MPNLLLTCDLGNSHCKLRLWDVAGPASAEPVASETLPNSPELPMRLRSLAHLRASSGALSSVAAPALEAEIIPALASLCGGRLQVGPPAGLEILPREPERVGRDRLYAARGAFERFRSACICVDAGTALTVDLVRAGSSANARAVFAGGAIAPGPALLARALGEGAARLPRIDPRPGAPVLGLDTQAALAAGISHGFRGAARELVLGLEREAGLGPLPIALTGGALDHLLEPGPFVEREIAVLRELVHLGLLAAMRDLERQPT